MLNHRQLFLTCCVVILAVGCNLPQGKMYLRHDLANLGSLALSQDNPYLATNLLLSREKENSPVLRGFVEVRGNPDAVEVRKKVFQAYRLYFYYVDKNEAYALEQGSGDWVIRGPVPIPGTILSSLSDIPRTSAKPVAPTAKRELPPAKGYQSRAALALPKATLSDSATDTQTTDSGPTTNREVVSSSGDLLHHVTFPGETLRMISNWYTGDTSNVKRIARINGLENPNVLSLGEEIRIPRYLLTKTDMLTEAEVSAWKRAHPVSAPAP